MPVTRIFVKELKYKQILAYLLTEAFPQNTIKYFPNVSK